MTQPPPLYAHQNTSLARIAQLPRVFDMSEPGTGKTRVHLEAWAQRHREGGKALVVLAPKSVLQPVWAAQIEGFLFGYTYSVAFAANREEAFNAEADIFVTNTDAVTWLARQPPRFFRRFDTLVVDESSYFRNRASQRSQALNKIKRHFAYRALLSGTPTGKSVADLWHQVLFLDDGARLGRSFYRFRDQVQYPVQIGPEPEHVKWHDKPGAETRVADLIADITIRHRLQDCIDLPDHVTRTVEFQLTLHHRAQYRALARESMLALQNDRVSAVNAAVLATKLLQLVSGAVYSNNGYARIATERYELIMELVRERQHSLVFFVWTHQRTELTQLAKKLAIDHAVIDGTVSAQRRAEIVEDFQKGFFQALFLHPRTAGHGLNLTRATTTIWSSPTYEPDLFQQGNARIRRPGQTQKTETILIKAAGTLEERIYRVLADREARMVDLLELLAA